MFMAVCPRCRTEANTGLSADDWGTPQQEPKLQVLMLCDDCNEYQKILVNDLQMAADEARA
jgi:hypothetical protein